MRFALGGSRSAWRLRAALLLVLQTVVGFAETDLRRELFEPSRWHSFGTSTGLPPGPITALVELENETVWAATSSGVYWYDGFRWHAAPGLPNELAVHLIAYDRERLLVRFGPSLYLGGTQGFRALPILPHAISLAVLNDRTILAHTQDNLYFLDSGVWKEWTGTLPRLPASYFQSSLSNYQIPISSAPQLLGALGSALVRATREAQKAGHFVAKSLVVTKLAENARGEGIASIIHPLEVSGIWEWGPGREPALSLSSSARADSMTITEAGDALVHLSSTRAYFRQRGVWQEFDPRPGIFQTLRYFQSGSNDRLWFSDDNGLHLFRRGEFLWETVLDPDAGAGSVSQMLHRADGSWWIAAESGLVIRSRDGAVTIHGHVGSVPIVGLTSIAEDANGHIWIASGRTFDGAFRWNGHEWKRFGAAEGLRSGPIHRIYRGRQGRMWFVATGNLQKSDSVTGGAWRFENGKFTHLGTAEGLPSGRVYGVAEAPDGSLWFAGATFVSRYDRGVWTHDRTGLSSGTGLFTLAVDPNGRPWFADRAHGLGTINSKGQRHTYTTSDGLISNTVFELLTEKDTIWVGTRTGLSALRNGRFFRFGSYSGLTDTRLWPLAQDRQGRICAGGSAGGVYCLSPSFERLPAARIVVDPPLLASSGVGFRWTASSHWARIPAGEIETRHRLDQKPWSEWRKLQQDVQLSGLSSGNHQLQIQARGPFGTVDTQGVSVPFHIDPPYYRTAGFLIPVSASLIGVTALAWTATRRRTQYRRDIESSERRFRALFEHSSDCIVLFDRNWVINYVSPSLTRITGYAPEEIVGSEHLEMLHPGDVEERDRRRDAALATPNTPFTFRMRVVHKNGAELWIEGTTCNLLEEPSIGAIVTNFRDITGRVRAEAALTEARSQAEEASRAKSSFLATMSHEIRTPMNGILGITDLLSTTPMNAEQKESFEIIRKSARALLHIINDILDLSRIEAGAVTLEESPFSLRELITDVQNLLSHAAREKGIHLETIWLSRIPNAVRGDGARLRQILLNLAGNAIKFTERGTVAIKVSATDLDGDIIHLRVSVADTGIGIAPENLDSVFSKFAQADTTTTRRYGGSGLGLAIAKSLVELMGGSISAQSKLGSGSEFTISLNLSTDHQPFISTPSPVLDAALTRLAGTVLVVEDNKVNQMVATRLLSRLGCQSEVASNGREALAMLQSNTYDVVLMDCHMPEMDGYEAAREIRRGESGSRHIPVIAMTANAMSDSRRDCIAAGMDGFIAKPVGIAELHAALASYLTQNVQGAIPAPPEAIPER